VIFPAIRPILLIITSLSILWDFRVFTQIYVLQRAGGISRETNLLGVYAYRISIGENAFDIGAAIAIVMVLITMVLTATYLRSMIRQDEL
jgi:N,N'-diacetylchitobiose transport system permease protein